MGASANSTQNRIPLKSIPLILTMKSNDPISRAFVYLAVHKIHSPPSHEKKNKWYNLSMSTELSAGFHPVITEWFRGVFGEPTLPQKLGWPLITQGSNTLILAPTGSGKTLAAFLAGINRVLCDLENGTSPGKGVEILYISPLKALNYDIERNLEGPLKGIQETADKMGRPLPEITTAVRTGDTPQAQRRKMLTRPPHILITTPESLHIVLTSSARKVLETVRYIIVDEIHALSPNKRGVFLSVVLERLEEVCSVSPVRIGLSATQKPLSEVASFLGGFDNSGNPRPVEIVDTGVRRQMDLKVVCTCEDLRHPNGGSVWPSIFSRLLHLVQAHKSTIIFANTRRIVEKLTMGINDLAGEEIVRPHHGSVSAPIRRSTEAALKNGTVKGVVATGTLELGIDMGSVELVCQVESPKGVSRGLQRVGRAGHALKAISKGRIIAKTKPDLAEAVSIAQGMIEGDVEWINVPKNCLDVLAQQIVAMAALEGIAASDVYNVIRRSYPFYQLSEEAFNLTLQLVSGRYPSKAFKDLKARISLDRVTGRISPLPGSQRLVISNGGAIPDTGEYGVYLSEANLKIGELDEEFVYEAREGDTFSLGTNSWRIIKIETDRVMVSHGSAQQSQVPFWNGESVPRSARTGRRMGALLGDIAEKGDDAFDWVMKTLPVDQYAADNLCSFVKTQTGVTGDSGLPTDKRIVLECFTDEVGGRAMALVSTFGGRIHHALRIALSALMKREMGFVAESVMGDNGVLFRLPEGDAPPPFGLMRLLTPELAYELINIDLPDTALFGLRFRQNAARALLLPGAGPGKRTPLWLQRLKAKDLLQIAKSFDGFPIVVETYRECLQDYLDLDALREILAQVQSGEIAISEVERMTPSPLVSTMLLEFQMIFQYEWDDPKTSGKERSAPRERRLVDELIDGKVGRQLDEQAISDMDNMLQGRSERYVARTAEELYERVRRLGDIPEADAANQTADTEFVGALLEEGRLVKITLANARIDTRLVACDHLDEYLLLASEVEEDRLEAIHSILDRHISSRAVVTPSEIALDYGFSSEIVEAFVENLATNGELVEIPVAPDTQARRWTSPDNLEKIYRRTLAVQKSVARLASPAQYSAFLLRHQHIHPDHRLQGQDGVRQILRQLEGMWLPYSVWESEILARRVGDYRTDQIDNLGLSAEFMWIGQSPTPDKPGNIAFLAREGLPALYRMLVDLDSSNEDTPQHAAVRQALQRRGASFVIDLVLDTGLDSRIVQRVLWEMIWTGEVTHDFYKLIRAGKPAEVSSVKSEYNPTRPADRKQFYRTRSRIAKTFTQPPNSNPGRWALLSSLAGHDTDEQESLEIYARVMLERYGVVAKDLVIRAGEPDVIWGKMYEVYQRMELSGEIERGYYVEGLAGAQFGTPEAVDDLMGRTGAGTLRAVSDERPVLVNACDPAYLYYSSGPFQNDISTFNRLPSNYAVLIGGTPAVTLEMGSKALNIREDLSDQQIESSIKELEHLTDTPWPIRPYRKIEITTLNNASITSSQISTHLESIGFEEENGKFIKRG